MSKPIDQEREAFEQWRLANFCGGHDRLKKCSNAPDVYYYTAEQEAWKVWQARAAVQPAGVAVPELNKTREQWKKVDAHFCANNNSPAANMHLIKDAQHDIERLHRALAAPHPVSGEQKAIRRTYPDWGVVRQSDSAISIVHGATYVTFREGEDDKRMPWLVDFLSSLLDGRNPVDSAAQGVAGLVEALEEIAGGRSSKSDPYIARQALAAHRAQQGERP